MKILEWLGLSKKIETPKKKIIKKKKKTTKKKGKK